MKEDKSSLKGVISKKEAEGKVVFMSFDGPMEADIDTFIDQPIEGLLYDLNRDRATVLSFVDKDPKWVNDYAVGSVITRLKMRLLERSAEKEICEMILETISRFGDAQNIGVAVLDKYKNADTGIVPELREIAFYVQRLARGWHSQQKRADGTPEKEEKS